MKKVFAIVLMIITLGGCTMKEDKTKSSSDLPSADWAGAKEAVTTNLTAIFEKTLEEKYGESLGVTKDIVWGRS